MRVLLTALVVTIAVTVGGTAGAQTYSGGGSLTVDDPTVAPGDTISATATGFAPGSEVTFTFTTSAGSTVVGTATVDADGVARLQFVVPTDTPPGIATLAASGTAADGSPLELRTDIRVTGATDAATPVAGAPLARTGSNTDTMLRLGAVLVVAGAFLVLAVRKRSASMPTTHL